MKAVVSQLQLIWALQLQAAGSLGLSFRPQTNHAPPAAEHVLERE